MPTYIDPRIPKGSLQAVKQGIPYDLSAAIPTLKVLYGTTEGADQDTAAFVTRQMPDALMINSRAHPETHQQFPQLVPHEYEHALQYNVDKRYKPGYDMTVVDEYKRMLPPDDRNTAQSAIVKILERAAVDKELYNHLKKLGMHPSPYLGDAPKGWMSLREQWADLSGLETAHKRDLTKDPVVRDRMFGNDQALIDTYKGTTGLRTNRLDARDLPPMTAYSTRKTEPVVNKGNHPDMVNNLMAILRGRK